MTLVDVLRGLLSCRQRAYSDERHQCLQYGLSQKYSIVLSLGIYELPVIAPSISPSTTFELKKYCFVDPTSRKTVMPSFIHGANNMNKFHIQRTFWIHNLWTHFPQLSKCDDHVYIIWAHSFTNHTSWLPANTTNLQVTSLLNSGIYILEYLYSFSEDF